MQPFLYSMTISGPYGQYTVDAFVDAFVDPRASYSSVPAPALIEMGIEPVRVVQLRAGDGRAHFRQAGRALTTVAGVEDIAPVLFGEPGEPAVLSAATMSVLMLRAGEETQRLVPAEGWLNHANASLEDVTRTRER